MVLPVRVLGGPCLPAPSGGGKAENSRSPPVLSRSAGKGPGDLQCGYRSFIHIRRRAQDGPPLDQLPLLVIRARVEEGEDADAETIRARLVSQITQPVRWTETMVALRSAGAGTLVEAGPGSVLKGLARRVDGLAGVSVEDGGVDVVLEGLEA